MGAGGSVCGVSASIAVGGAVRADKEQIAISISLVTVWATPPLFVQVTVPPGPMVTPAGWNPVEVELTIVTAALIVEEAASTVTAPSIIGWKEQ